MTYLTYLASKMGIIMQKPSLPFLILLLLSLPSTPWGDELELEPEPGPSKLHFVLVHGACFGAWSWYKVTTYLQSAGHNVTALDMAGAGIDPTKPESVSSMSEYFEPLFRFMEALALDAKIVVVGHSMGGLGISMAMEKFPEKICAAIFVTAAMPPPLPWPLSSTEEQKQKRIILGMYDGFYTEDHEIEDEYRGLGQWFFTQQQLATLLYPLSPSEDVTLAIALERPVRAFDVLESLSELKLSREKYGSVKRAFVISEDDKMMPEEIVELMLSLNEPDLVSKIKGCDHMVMASKPRELAQQLHTIAHQLSSSSSAADV